MANTKTPLIAAALSHLALERVAAAIIEVPDTKPQQYVAIGTAATISMLLEIDGVSAGIKSWSERMPAPWQEPVCSMNCSPPCTSKERESCGDCAIVTRRGDPIKARDEEIAELRQAIDLLEAARIGWKESAECLVDEVKQLRQVIAGVASQGAAGSES